MADDAWELIDLTTRSLLAVGSMWQCVIARLDVVGASVAQQVSPGELVVRPHVQRGGSRR